MFTQKFGKYVCEGDTIRCTVGKFEVQARIYRDDCTDAPDKRDDGFWPSKDPKATGYVKPGNYPKAMHQARKVMAAWINDEWYYCGVALVVEKNGIKLTERYANALWGIECNYPGSDNAGLSEVANELLGEALAMAKERLATLCDCED
jgi:hypothetical protein